VSVRTLQSPEQFIAWSATETLRIRQAVPCVLDIAYGPAKLQKLDIYHPATGTGHPVLVDVHGGGWHRGSKNGRGFPAASLTPKGLVWVPIDYRLVPAASLAEMIDDVRAALAWIYANVADYGADANRICVTGHSAGAQLAAMVLMDGWHADHGVPRDVVKGSCLVSGVYDMQPMAHSFGISAAEARRYTPYLNPPSSGCPAIFSYGSLEHSEMGRQSRAFAQMWRDAGFVADEIECPGDDHFSIARTLADPASPLNQALLKMMGL
jgi:arylformamidase